MITRHRMDSLTKLRLRLAARSRPSAGPRRITAGMPGTSDAIVVTEYQLGGSNSCPGRLQGNRIVLETFCGRDPEGCNLAPMGLRDLIEAVGLRRDQTVKIIQSAISLRSPFELTPEDFLERAQQDFEVGGSSAQLNALTNAKRAIECQVDSVLSIFGCDEAIQAKKIRKFDFLTTAGFLAPRILRRVSDARNLLEHEYTSPSETQVEEALDLAALFVSSLSRHLASFESEFTLGNASERVDMFGFSRELTVIFRDGPKHFRVEARTGVLPDHIRYAAIDAGRPQDAMFKRCGEVFIAAQDIAFVPILQLVNAGNRVDRMKIALEGLFGATETA
jgi:hypothetical protein